MGLEPRSKLQPPFRQKDLCGLSEFIGYCRGRGVETSEKRLEYYEKKNLLLPAVRVNYGIVEHRKADGQTCFKYGSLGWGTKDWLVDYKRRGLVEYPAETEFRGWTAYRGVCPQKSHYFPEVPPPRHETFYSKLQIFPLREIQDGLVVRVIDGQLFAQDGDWIEAGRRVRPMFTGMPEILQRRVLRYYETFALLNEILDLLTERHREADQEYERTLAEYSAGWPKEAMRGASEAAWDSIDLQDASKMPRRARAILRKSGLSVKEVEKRREEFAYLGFTVDPTHGLSISFNRAIQLTLEAASREFKLAGECYDIAEQLGWFLRMVGEHPPSLEKIQSGIDALRACKICQRLFIPKRKSDVTCGSRECVSAHRKELKAEWKRKRRKKV